MNSSGSTKDGPSSISKQLGFSTNDSELIYLFRTWLIPHNKRYLSTSPSRVQTLNTHSFPYYWVFSFIAFLLARYLHLRWVLRDHFYSSLGIFLSCLVNWDFKKVIMLLFYRLESNFHWFQVGTGQVINFIEVIYLSIINL